MAIKKMRKFISKLFIFVLFSIIIITMVKKLRTNQKSFRFLGSKAKRAGMKYILLWTSKRTIPFVYLGKGRRGFIDRKCAYTNCIVSGNTSVLGRITDFDAILFHGPELQGSDLILPGERLPYQKFVFASIESPANYPLCGHDFNGYFNWTWTFKLDSDIRWGYIVIKDSNGNIVGPGKDMNWIKWKNMEPVSETFKQQLRGKSKAVAWFVSNCFALNTREIYVAQLRTELSDKYDLDVDIYGHCGNFSCSRDKQEECARMISKDYYFYLSFENAFSEDYVTEKLLHALQNNAVPIVYGGANYSRFLPERSYLNAKELTVTQLAEMIHELIRQPETYAEFFRWKKYYSYYQTTQLSETNEYCNMCAALNDDQLIRTTSVYNEFSEFWEVYDTCNCVHSDCMEPAD